MMYLLEIAMFQFLFLGVYYMFKNETFFNYNRAYLLITSCLSYALPFIELDTFSNNAIPNLLVNELPTLFLNGNVETITNISSSLFVWHWWYVPALGSLAMLTVFVVKFRKLYLLSKLDKTIHNDSVVIINLKNSNTAFSFFNWVFIGDKLNNKEREIVLEHELIHVKEKHSLDLMFFEFQRIVFWFNPMVYIYQNEIKAIHEYIVDQQMIDKKGTSIYCQNLLTQLFNSPKFTFVNTFYKQSLIKKRIAMITKKESKSRATLKYALIIPVITGMLFYTSCQQNEREVEENVEEEVYLEVIDGKTYMRKNNLSETETFYDTIYINNGTQEEMLKEMKEVMDLERKRKNKRSYVTVNNETLKIMTRATLPEDIQKKNKEEIEDVPFAAIQNPPVFPGCVDVESITNKKKCFNEKVNRFIGENFDTGLAEELGLTGIQRMAAIFKIDTNGNVSDIRIKAKSEELKNEFDRTLKALPKMEPATQNGRKVNLLFSLPLVFRVETTVEKESEEE